MTEEEMSTGQFDRLQEQKAPAASRYPKWFQKNFPPAALYTVMAIGMGATVTVTWFVADAKSAHVRADLFAADRKEDHKLLEEEVGEIKAINGRLDVLQKLVIGHEAENAYKEGVVKGSTITKAEKKAARQGK